MPRIMPLRKIGIALVYLLKFSGATEPELS
jgi:hypothetical protein